MKKILLIPSVKKNWGTGHLKRCLRLLSLLGPGARILIPPRGSSDSWGREDLFGLLPQSLAPGFSVEGPGKDSWDLVVFDRRMTSLEELKVLGGENPTLGLDEGGPVRGWFSFLIDTFPRLSPDCPPNIFREALIAEGPVTDSPRRPERLRRVLLSFGGEDPAGLTEKTYEALTTSGLIEAGNIDVVIGPLFSRPFKGTWGKTIRGENEIRHLFSAYDAVFTSYGITPYEVIKEGSSPIIINPTDYHEKLSGKAGFPTLGLGSIGAGPLKKWLENPGKYLYPSIDKKILGNGDLARTIEGLLPAGRGACTVCGPRLGPSVWRTEDKTYFTCSTCGLEYLQNFGEEPVSYDRGYFFEEYRKHYGKTYLEDFDTIKIFSRERLQMINDCGISLPGKDLLDVGCAYGPFLLAAREKGLRPRGLDVSEEAVRYVGQTLNLPAAGGDFMDFRSVEVFGISSFDIVTLWYVIEHFEDPGGAMGKLAALVRPGGVLAFATPHRRGVTGRFFPELFYRQSPKDHFTLWDPKSAERVLSVYGFKIRKIRITGHHPERFPRFMIRVFGYYLCGIISKIFGLGDTFEVYADKERRES